MVTRGHVSRRPAGSDAEWEEIEFNCGGTQRYAFYLGEWDIFLKQPKHKETVIGPVRLQPNEDAILEDTLSPKQGCCRMRRFDFMDRQSVSAN